MPGRIEGYEPLAASALVLPVWKVKLRAWYRKLGKRD